jgi:hypothetical protein
MIPWMGKQTITFEIKKFLNFILVEYILYCFQFKWWLRLAPITCSVACKVIERRVGGSMEKQNIQWCQM